MLQTINVDGFHVMDFRCIFTFLNYDEKSSCDCIGFVGFDVLPGKSEV